MRQLVKLPLRKKRNSYNLQRSGKHVGAVLRLMQWTTRNSQRPHPQGALVVVVDNVDKVVDVDVAGVVQAQPQEYLLKHLPQTVKHLLVAEAEVLVLFAGQEVVIPGVVEVKAEQPLRPLGHRSKDRPLPLQYLLLVRHLSLLVRHSWRSSNPCRMGVL